MNGKLGRCIICDKRVKTEDLYITTEEGYAHRNCLKEVSVIKA